MSDDMEARMREEYDRLTDGNLPMVFDLRKSIDLLTSGKLSKKERLAHTDFWLLSLDPLLHDPDFDWSTKSGAMIAEFFVKLYSDVKPLKCAIIAENPFILGTDKGLDMICSMLREPSKDDLRRAKNDRRDAKIAEKCFAINALTGMPLYASSSRKIKTSSVVASEALGIEKPGPESIDTHKLKVRIRRYKS